MEIESSPFRLMLAPLALGTSPASGGGKKRVEGHPLSSPVYGGGGSHERSDCEPEGGMPHGIVAIGRTWIGTPYVHQASVKHVGCDCLGLLRGIWRELCGEEAEEIPPYSQDWAEATGAETLYMALERHAREIDRTNIAAGDIALFRMQPRGPAKHCGIVAAKEGGRTLIHARQNKRVSEEPFSAFWRAKLAFAFRI